MVIEAKAPIQMVTKYVTRSVFTKLEPRLFLCIKILFI